MIPHSGNTWFSKLMGFKNPQELLYYVSSFTFPSKANFVHSFVCTIPCWRYWVSHFDIIINSFTYLQPSDLLQSFASVWRSLQRFLSFWLVMENMEWGSWASHSKNVVFDDVRTSVSIPDCSCIFDQE
jgi:hypothetical protein